MLKMVGAGCGHLPQLHVPYESMAREAPGKAATFQQLKTFHSTLGADIDAWLARKGQTPEAVRFQTVLIGVQRFAVLLHSTRGAVLGITPFALSE